MPGPIDVFDEARLQMVHEASFRQREEELRLFALHAKMTDEFIASLDPHVVDQLRVIQLEDAAFSAAHRAQDSFAPNYMEFSVNTSMRYYDYREERLKHLAELAGLHRSAFLDWLASKARTKMFESLDRMQQEEADEQLQGG